VSVTFSPSQMTASTHSLNRRHKLDVVMNRLGYLSVSAWTV